MKDDVSIIGAMIALAGVLVSALISLVVSGRSNYINAVTAERSKWIDKLRINLAEILCAASNSQISFARSQSFSQSNEWHETIRKIELLLATLKLQLNPKGEIDANIIVLLDAIPGAIEGGYFRNVEPLLVGHSQALLKDEWEKVKRESRGLIFAPVYWISQKFRQHSYRVYARGSGSVDKYRERS